METKKIRIPGSVDTTLKYQSLHNYFSGIEVKSFTTGVVRGAGETNEVEELNEDDVVVTEFENGIRWVHSSGDFVSKLRSQQPFARGAAAPDEIVVPSQWQEDNAPSRGLISSGLKLVGINVIKNVAGRALAKDIAKRVEQNNPNILYNCDENFNFAGAFDKTKAVSAPYLLLIHGTGSNTKGGFGGLSTGIKNIYKPLYEQYGKRVIAYEHKTFSQSPVQNIIELVRQLPDTITIDIISHSRGGLLGEVLARISSSGWKGVFTEPEMDLLKSNPDAATLIAEIGILNGEIQNKKIKVNRFVRVACPAAGTTLVSERADKLLNVLCNALSAIPGEIASTLIDGLTALLTAVVNEKNNTETLPGIECMKPDSSFIKALNYYETKIDSDLIVIAGDSVGEGFFNKIKMFLIDSFYKEDNDLVVNTLSMKKGTARTKEFMIYDEQAGNVNHFNYFINDSSQKIILQALAGNASQTRGFYSSDVLQRGVVPDVTIATNRSGASLPKDMPVLYVLPGIMGSNLQVEKEPIWLRYIQIMKGGLGRLKISDTDRVEADSINGKAYRKLTDYLSNSYYVIPFAYDWRKSVFAAADKLRDSVAKTLAETDKTISFIVHSMGGLVLRAFAIRHTKEWNDLIQRSNFRVLMMGTPNEGSYTVPRLLIGNDKTINALAALDLTNNKKGLLAQFVQYPGLLQLLPSKKDKYDFGVVSEWNRIMSEAGVDYTVPDEKALLDYMEMRGADFSDFVFDPSIITYIAGRGDQTPMRMEYNKDNNKVDFYATPLGDGVVTWSSIPTALLDTATYYVNAEHGNIANHEASFQGYRDLLATGKTDKLSKKQPVTRGESQTELMPEQDRVTVPDENALIDHIIGIEPTDIKAPKQQVEISIMHGDLGHAMYPIVAGHFKRDGILQAEKIINQKLGNYLSIRHAMNNYPGEIGTHEVIFQSPRKSAIIVGLGEFGGLTENRLSQTLRQALLTYIIKSKSQKAADDTSNGFLGISYLLIGSGFGGLTIYSCIKALLNAVKEANDFFENGNYNQYDLINKIEIVELYQYKAIQAGRIIRSILSNNQFTNVSFVPDNIKRASGAKTEIPDEMQTDWWQRLKVAQQEDSGDKDCNGKPVSRVITFSSITDKARNEETVLNTNINLVDNLIKRAAAVTNNNKQLCQTLYEMLVPNEFKGYGSDLRNIVLLVDKETARYPWEMMMDAYGDNKDPLVTKTGFLRQLATSTYRERVEISFEDNALVVGNPTLNNYYPDLPGAGVEAEKVAELLAGFAYTVNNKYINTESSGVLTELYSTPYKIIHIAAHGVLKDKVTCQTGIVLGEQLILTPSDFKQLRKVPELVFINCCSLGTINKEDEERLQRKFQVAAGIGTELIEIGVKAVIVAGWEVNDDAAVNFSYTFYTQLLNGKNFGDAVKDARESTYKAYPKFNTWGAYQCYGDPLYRLRVIENSSTPDDIFFCDPIEAVNKLQTLASLVESASTRDAKDAIDRDIKRVTKAIDLHPEWKYDASIAEQMAELYKRLGMMDKAIETYERLFLLEDAQYTVRTIEQYCNVKVKQAAKKCKQDLKDGKQADKRKAVTEATAIIREMIQRLQNLNISPTSERYNLMGSAYRRLAEINESTETKYIENLAESANSYYNGYSLSYASYGKTDHYPLYNWLITASVLTDLKSMNPKPKKYEGMLTIPDNLESIKQNASLYAAELTQKQPDFWNRTADSTRYLLQLILATDKENVEKAKQDILQNHKEAWEIEGSVFKQNAIKEHAEFVISMFKILENEFTKMQLVRQKIQALESLASALAN